jgi:beta-N-acetylhexosaminidase
MAQNFSELRRDVGQLLIMGFNGTEAGGQLKVILQAIQPAGVILFARNIVDPRQTYELVTACQNAVSELLFRCVDLEGGTVDRFRNILAHTPSVQEVVAAADKKFYRKHGRIIGEEVRALGFNVDFAPVLDLRFPPSLGVLTARTVSTDPSATVAFAREFLKGLGDAGVLGCGKHFPGLGEAALDTHMELPRIDKPLKTLWDEDLKPYRAMRKELPFVMVAHAAYPEVSRDGEPASLSRKWIADILRKQIGYRGLVISDDLEMGGVLAAGSIEQAAVKTLRAGADLFLVCHNEEMTWRAYEAVLREAERDKKFQRYVAACAKRIRRFKQKSPEIRKHVGPPSDRTLEKLKRNVEQFRDEITRAAVRAQQSA